jgi:glucokinase
VRRVLAIDIGGTKIAAAVIDEHGGVERRARMATVDPAAVMPTRAADPGDALADRVAALAAEVVDGLAIEACGVGCGGPMRPGGATVSPLNIVAWRDYPLRDALADRLGLAVVVDNDAKVLALAEGWVGTAIDVSDYVAMVVSTGVGGGLVCDGRLLDGALGNAGHIGHLEAVADGRPCACGARGCLEAEVSGLAIAARTGHPAVDAPLAERVRAGTLVGVAVADVVNLLDLRRAVVGGSVALGFAAPFFAAAQAVLDRRCRLDYARGVRIVPSALGGDGGVIGAAALAWRSLGVPTGGGGRRLG